MDEEYPDKYLCPITLDLMLDPVKASDNKIYDKIAIIDWLKKNKVSPITNEAITSEFIKQNELKVEIGEFINKNNIKIIPYSPKNYKKENSFSNSESSNSESEGVNDLVTFDCNRCNEGLLFSTTINRTVCSNCRTSYKITECQNCQFYYIIEENSTGNYICRNCNAKNVLSSSHIRRRRKECIIM